MLFFVARTSFTNVREFGGGCDPHVRERQLDTRHMSYDVSRLMCQLHQAYSRCLGDLVCSRGCFDPKTRTGGGMFQHPSSDLGAEGPCQHGHPGDVPAAQARCQLT